MNTKEFSTQDYQSCVENSKLDDLECYQKMENIITTQRREHNFYILINRNENTHSIYQLNDSALDDYSINTLNEKCKTSFFEHLNTIGVNENTFGNTIFDVNHINNYGVILTRTNKKCEIFCENT